MAHPKNPSGLAAVADLRISPEPDKANTGSLHRGLAVIDAIVRAERPISMAEITELVGLNPSTTHRLLQALMQTGHVYRDSSKRYYPGARALFPANLFHPLITLRRAVTEELLALRSRFGLAASFVIFMRKQRWVMETIHANDFLSPYSDTVISDSLHATVSGKILLSTMAKYERAGLIGPDPYQAHTPQTILSAEALDQELGRVAERGYAMALDEKMRPTACRSVDFRKPRCAGGPRKCCAWCTLRD